MAHKRAVILLALACGRTPEPAVQGTAPATADTVAQGIVRVVGTQEAAQVVLGGTAGEVAVAGPLAGEIRRLVGARVSVTGAPAANPGGLQDRAVLVAAYEVLAVNGERPFVGVMLRRDGRLWLADGDTLELAAAPPDLAARTGAKVFVVGDVSDGRLSVRSYGVIREP